MYFYIEKLFGKFSYPREKRVGFHTNPNLCSKASYELPSPFAIDLKYKGPKKTGTLRFFAFTSSNIYRISNLFHYQNQEHICNSNVSKDPITPQVCRYTT